MNIRQERPEEFHTIYQLVETAFQTAKVSNGDEQNYVNRLRAGSGYLPELALVVEDGSTLIGHIMLTKIAVDTKMGPVEVLLLAPVAVDIRRRKRGLGSALIREAFRLAKEKSFKVVVLVGDPAFYARFGFRSAASFGISNTQNIPDQYVMALELTEHALANAAGALTFPL